MAEQLFNIEKLINCWLPIDVINGKTIFAGRLSLEIRAGFRVWVDEWKLKI